MDTTLFNEPEPEDGYTQAERRQAEEAAHYHAALDTVSELLHAQAALTLQPEHVAQVESTLGRLRALLDAQTARS
jgi:hypothetical protein